MHIRRAEPNDAEEIAAVLLAAFRGFEAQYTPEHFRATTPSAAEISPRFSEGPLWVATEGDVVVGTVSALRRGEEIYIRSMAVLPEARASGIGTQLLSVVQAYAMSTDARRLSLHTTSFLTAAIRLYEKAGFERTIEPTVLYGTSLIGMVKELP